MNKQNILRLGLAILTCQLAGLVGSLFTQPAIEPWYALLNKPSFSPPSWLFAPAWLTLYTLMGIALYLISKQGINRQNKRTLWLFYIHLIINALWSIIFFGLRSPLGGLVTIIILWGMILVLIKEFWSINKTASRLLWPYYLWVSFASILNLSIWLLN